MPDVDLLVAGAGAAGLASALAAAERGASVAVAEAQVTFRQDSNTAMSTSMVPAGGSRWQHELGIEDSPAAFLADVQKKTHGTAHPAVSRSLVTAAPDLVAWLADVARVPLELVTDFNYPGHAATRCHTVADRAGKTLHRHLLEAVDAAGVTLMVPLSLDDLIFEKDQVIGARLVNPDGATDDVTASAVVLATNGFGASAEHVRRFIPEMDGALYFGGHGSRGTAITLAERHELDLASMGAYQGHGSVATPHGVLVTWATVMHGAVIVDSSGSRFADETIGYSEFARLVLDRPGGEAWLILDESVDAASRVFADYQDLLAAGAVKWAADAGELAALTGVPLANLRATLERAADSASEGSADPFGRSHWEAPLRPPYGAVKITGALFHTQGGLDVDGNAAVLRGGRPVGGLHAAGGAAVGMSGEGADGYLAGNGLLAALGLGFIAGRQASK